MVAYWRCPYCGLKNATHFTEKDDATPRVVYCDVEEGGCDQAVAIHPIFSVTTQVFKLIPAAGKFEE